MNDNKNTSETEAPLTFPELAKVFSISLPSARLALKDMLQSDHPLPVPEVLFQVHELLETLSEGRDRPEVAHSIWQDATFLTSEFMKITKDPELLKNVAPTDPYIPWLKTPWQEFDGFEEALENLGFASKNLDTTTKSHLNSPSTGFVIDAVSLISILRQLLSGQTSEKGNITDDEELAIAETMAETINAYMKLPPLSASTRDEWWQDAIGPMAERFFYSRIEGEEEGEDTSGYRFKQPTPRVIENYCRGKSINEGKNEWKKACKQSLGELILPG